VRRTPLFAILFMGACLDPAPEELDLTARFGAPDINPANAPHVEDNPALAKNVQAFATRVAYLNGFAEGDPIRYWNVDGPNATFIAPMFQIVGPDGPIGRPIIDVLPGDPGYTPWWREVYVRTTAKYAGERIWSREGIDAGLMLGILELPEDQPVVKNCPVILREKRIPVDIDKDVEPTWGWYRNQRVSWVDFKDRVEVEVGLREIPQFPVYVLQRINRAEPIYEFAINTDLNGDGDLDDTNNIFGKKPGKEGYSPLWYVDYVRTVADYPSFDVGSSTVGLTAEDQFLNPAGEIISDFVVEPIIEARHILVNCSIQRVRGEL
jgi:hypothetical protein